MFSTISQMKIENNDGIKYGALKQEINCLKLIQYLDQFFGQWQNMVLITTEYMIFTHFIETFTICKQGYRSHFIDVQIIYKLHHQFKSVFILSQSIFRIRKNP